MARDLSFDLSRLEDAFEYQAQLEKLGNLEATDQGDRAKLCFSRVVRDFAADPSGLLDQLKKTIRDYPTYAPAYRKLAEVQIESENIEAAAQTLVRGAQLCRQTEFWRNAVALWLSKGQPERALGAARAAIKEAAGLEKLEAVLYLAKLYLHLNMGEEAKSQITQLMHGENYLKSSIPDEFKLQVLLCDGICHHLLGDHRTALQKYKEILAINLRCNR